MTHQEAIHLIEKANLPTGGIWADLGAGSGRFTLALAELIGEGGTIYAIDQKPNIPPPPASSASIIPQKEDFTKDLILPPLDGILMANSLHYVKNQESFLNNLLNNLKTNGIFLLVEYNMSRGNSWVPYPITIEKFSSLTQKVGLRNPEIIGQKPSVYGNGMIYAAKTLKAP